MKKWLSVLLALVLVLSVTACGSEPAQNATDSMNIAGESSVEQTTAEATEAADSGLDALVTAYFENMPDHIYKIAQDEFVSKVAAGEDMVIIDIRNAADYEAGHIQGAVNLPWGSAIAEGLSSIPSGKPVYIYCYTGQTAGQAVMTLNFAGIEARSVNFGWNLGISKVDGVDAYITTEASSFEGEGYTIDPDVQAAVTAYYNGLADVADTEYKNYKISEDSLKEKLDAGDDSIYVLSVRKAADYAAGHIATAANIPFGKDMASEFGTLPTDKTIVVYCYTGQTAGQTTAALRLMGYDAVSLNGGMGTAANAPSGWANKGYPVVNEVTDALDALYGTMPDHIYKIAQDEFVSKVAAGEDLAIIDIRSAADYEAGHVKGAVNMPWGPAIAEQLGTIPTDQTVYVYCYTGQTAGQTVTLLNVAGIDARSVNFGWNLGISKVDGVDAVTTTEPATFDGSREVPEAIQTAITNYYNGLADVSETEYKNYKISEDDLKAKVDAKDDSIVILSVRKAADYEAGHIEGAINVPFGSGMLDGFKDVLPTDKTIVVYCYTGQTAGQATAALRLMGYDAVSLNGGMGTAANAPSGWANKGYPVVQ